MVSISLVGNDNESKLELLGSVGILLFRLVGSYSRHLKYILLNHPQSAVSHKL